MYRYRILRFLPSATRVAIYYKTRDAMEAGARRWADRDRREVGIEEFCNPSTDPGLPMWNWWLDGMVKPA